MNRLIFLAAALIAGALLPVQAALNAKMGRAMNSPVAAAFISFAVGTAALCIYMLVSRQSPQLVSAARHAPWYAWLAGILGIFYVAGSIIILPRVGVALTFSLIILGQLVVSMVMDHFGLFGVEIKTVNFYRIVGVLLLISGVVLIRKF